jgi:hypothetical protein
MRLISATNWKPDHLAAPSAAQAIKANAATLGRRSRGPDHEARGQSFLETDMGGWRSPLKISAVAAQVPVQSLTVVGGTAETGECGSDCSVHAVACILLLLAAVSC